MLFSNQILKFNRQESRVSMKTTEKSCGAVVYFIDENSDEERYLVIKHVNGGHWAFAKGHVEEGESESETALREIEEETNIREVKLDTNFRESTQYSPEKDIIKEVIYFIAETSQDQALKVEKQEAELLDFAWLPFEEAQEKLTYENDIKILEQAHSYLIKN